MNPNLSVKIANMVVRMEVTGILVDKDSKVYQILRNI